MSARTWQQRLKWTVYALLVLDFILYLIQDAESAAHILGPDAPFLEWARAYVTSIDVGAWLALILLFEVETYRVPRRKGSRVWHIRGLRLLCYVVVLHTTFADASILRDFQTAQRLADAADLCEYTGGDWSFLRNRGYTHIDEANCNSIGTGPAFFVIDPDPVITDRAGLHEGLILAWTDLVENVAWLLIVLANEILVRLGAWRVTGGVSLKSINALKAWLYVMIVCIALYWGSKGQMLYLWDELLWVCGFLAIEKNILDARVQEPSGFGALRIN